MMRKLILNFSAIHLHLHFNIIYLFESITYGEGGKNREDINQLLNTPMATAARAVPGQSQELH